MSRTPLIITLGLALGLSTLAHAETVTDAQLAEARGLVKAFGGTLKKELQAALKAGGPEKGVEVCAVKAPQIASDLSTQSGWELGRTSLKTRNQGNQPDSWERAVLQAFESRKADGQAPGTLEYAEIVNQDGAQELRYMKAIPTAAVCLNCHGADEVKPTTAAAIANYYPDDMARGYQEGDLRGAFSFRKSL